LEKVYGYAKGLASRRGGGAVATGGAGRGQQATPLPAGKPERLKALPRRGGSGDRSPTMMTPW
jgi:hypothetical protein